MKSIRQQLTLRSILWLTGLLGAGLLAVYWAVWHEMVKSVDTALRARALSVAALSEFEDGHVQFDFTPDFLASYRAEHPHHFFEVRDSNGVALARSPSLQTNDLPWEKGGGNHRPSFYNVALPNGRPGRATAMVFTVNVTDSQGKTLGPLTLQLIEAVDRTELNEHLGALLAAIVACGALTIGATLWIIPRVLERGLAPLETLAARAEKIDAESLSTRFLADSLPSELKPIARRLNDLLARLEQSFERERRFSSDLAHELRTPLAELRNLAECALKWPDARAPDADHDVLAISIQMESLVNRMLTLARAEHGQVAANPTPTDVPAAVKAVWETYSKRAREKGLNANFTLQPGTVPADGVLLGSILHNLFDNACDYAPANSELRVTGSSCRNGYSLRVANPAGTLGDGDVAHFFDRFWRKDAARTGCEHFGLGLNLSRSLANAMGWTLTANIEQGWVVFTLASAKNPQTETGTS